MGFLSRLSPESRRTFPLAEILLMANYRITQPGDDRAVDVGSPGAIAAVIRAGKAGRYDMTEISRDLLPSGHTSPKWGTAIKHAEGIIIGEPDPWPNR
jgi:hypothetical protein